MHGLKSAILAILPEIGILGELAMPCSAALQNRPLDFFFSFTFFFLF